ncbi:hypothetical protein C479_05398 [Halovivax asiaticus JCM 14624]|uniref:Lipoprotein n=1 Tax=Halovivax asiaticus JCM 14624 TaxID=1227490 RepID=M0BP04_9EURY|nr:hypothetical protein [Halovivax asiaticus]ELZ12217.1 hypothetical protein C479_05398 [Halovivax asiaticus JCM 14624]
MNRRSVLALGGVACLGGLAGCLSSLGLDDESNDDGTDETDDGPTDGYGLDEFGRWIPVPDALDANPVTVTGMAPAALAATVGETPQGFGPGSQIADQPIELPSAADIDYLVGTRFGANETQTVHSGGLVAIRGDLDAETAAADLEAGGFEHDSSVGGYECYTDGGFAWGLGSEAFVAASFPEEPMEGLRQIIAADAGDEPRVVEERERFRTLQAAQPAGEIVFAEHATGSVTPVLAGTRSDAVVAAGESFDVHADETTITTTLVFTSTDAATESHLEAYVADSNADPENATYRLDGDVGEIEVTRPTDELL